MLLIVDALQRKLPWEHCGERLLQGDFSVTRPEMRRDIECTEVFTIGVVATPRWSIGVRQCFSRLGLPTEIGGLTV